MNGNTQEAKRLARRLFDRAVGILGERLYSMERAVDIGEEGLLLRFTRNLSEGQKVLINFWIEKAGYIILPAEVRWIKKDEKSNTNYCGLLFLKTSFEYRRALRRYIAAKPASEFEDEKIRMIFPPISRN